MLGAIQLLTYRKEFEVFSHCFVSPSRCVGGGDRFRVGLGAGVRVDVALGVTVEPDPRTDPRLLLTSQVVAAVRVCCVSCDRPCMVSGLSPGARMPRTGMEVSSHG